MPDVHPWAPGDGYLYELNASVPSASGEVVDSYRQPVGVRTVEVRDQQFLINGNPFYFRGFGKHEDAAVRGMRHDEVLMVHDLALLDWIGANSFRTAHYPFAEEMLDYADRHGVVVIGETAAVGLKLNIGGGVFASGGRVATFSPDKVSDETQRTHLRRRQQERHLHPRPPPQNRRLPPTHPLAHSRLSRPRGLRRPWLLTRLPGKLSWWCIRVGYWQGITQCERTLRCPAMLLI